MSKIFSISTILAVIMVALTAIPAAAKIHCKEGFQVISGAGLHATPYCETKYLSEVASSYGIKTSFKRLRVSESERETVCRAIGHDHRIDSFCHRYRNEGSDRIWD